MASISWVDKQKKAFTKWANAHLNERIVRINDLDTDVQDGVLLIYLVEIITRKQITKYNPKPKTRVQKIENIALLIKFLQDEGLKLTNIGAQDIADGNTKLILALLWTIILRFAICCPDCVSSPKNNLMAWVKQQLAPYNIEVRDFDSSWKDGRALCALTDSLQVGCLPMDSLSQDSLSNVELAITKASSLFSIPNILDPQDVVELPDDLSVMTYLTYFRDYDMAQKKNAEQAQIVMEANKRKEEEERRRAEATARFAEEITKARQERVIEEGAELTAADDERKRAEATARLAEEIATARKDREAEEMREEEERKAIDAKIREEATVKLAEEITKARLQRAEEEKEERDAKLTDEKVRAEATAKLAEEIAKARKDREEQEKKEQEEIKATEEARKAAEAKQVEGERHTDEASEEESEPLQETLYDADEPEITAEQQIADFYEELRKVSIAVHQPPQTEVDHQTQVHISQPSSDISQPSQIENENEAPRNETTDEPVTISAEVGGAITLDDGASLQVLPGTTATASDLSISVLESEMVEKCTQHDSMEECAPVSVYNCLPHGEEFTKPVLLKLPYDASIPVDQLAVFHMKTDSDGQPCGTWTMVEATFSGSTAVFLASSFSYYAVFQFTNATFQKKAKLTRTSNVCDMVYPGLTCRGKCKNEACTSYNKNVNWPFGFGQFDLDKDIDLTRKSPLIKCPLCQAQIATEKLVLHDTQALVQHTQAGVAKFQNEIVTDSEAVCLVINKKGILSERGSMSGFKVLCSPRQGSYFGIDICFVIDCTGSMGPNIDAAKTQSADLAKNLQAEVKKLGMECKVRIAFVGYRDYIYLEDNDTFETPDDIIFVVDFTENLDSIVEQMATQHAYGGGDPCENVLGGLREAVKLSWRGSSRTVILVTDAPCHGSEFYDNEFDHFPNGDPSGENPRFYLTQMLKKNISFLFLKISRRTDIMIEKFKAHYENDQYNAKRLRLQTFEMGHHTESMGALIQQGIMKQISGFTGE